MANINIYGKLYNNTVDKIIAGAEQIWDTTQNKMQDVINAELYAASGDIEGMIGQPDGIAGLGSDGKVPSSQLPSYVDDVLEYDNQSAFPKPGESGKIYVAKDTNKTYRWSGSAYVEISQSLALGETSSTAYAGDKGAANRAAISSLPSTIVSSVSRGTVGANAITLNVNRVTKSGLNYGSAAAANFDIPAATDTTAGLMSASDKAIVDYFEENRGGYIKISGSSQNPIRYNTDSVQIGNVYTGPLDDLEVAEVTIESVTSTKAGVMSTDMFNKLQGIAEGANNYQLPIAASDTLGGVKSSTTGTTFGKDYLVQVNADGTMKVNVPWTDTKYNLPVATASVLGGIKVGAGLAITAEGVLSATGGGEADSVAWANVSGKPSEFNPPLASATVRGGVKVGEGLEMLGENLCVDTDMIATQSYVDTSVELALSTADTKFVSKAGDTMTGNLNMTSDEPILTMTGKDGYSITLNAEKGGSGSTRIDLYAADGSTIINLETSEGVALLDSNTLRFRDGQEQVKAEYADYYMQIGTDGGDNIKITSADITKNGESIIPVALTTGEIEAICI